MSTLIFSESQEFPNNQKDNVKKVIYSVYQITACSMKGEAIQKYLQVCGFIVKGYGKSILEKKCISQIHNVFILESVLLARYCFAMIFV